MQGISKKVEQAVEALVQPVVEQAGYEYVGTEVKNAGDAKELIIYADKDGGLGLQDCEKISKMIDPIIEEADPIEDAYYLCVSSPGLDRPLKSAADFARSVGKTVDVKLYRAVDKQKNFTGTLESFGEEGFTISDNKGSRTFAYKDTAIVRLHVDIQ